MPRKGCGPLGLRSSLVRRRGTEFRGAGPRVLTRESVEVVIDRERSGAQHFRVRLPLVPALLLAALAIVVAGGPAGAAPDVTWSFADSISACPAGDSVAAGHPARLRVAVTYRQAPGGVPAPRVGAPPESIWVAWAGGQGVLANDQPGRAYADDSTDATGATRVTVPSFSGCGAFAFSLWVSGVLAGTGTASVRSTDSDADGAVTAEAACDLDWDGAITGADAALSDAHLTHSHRGALLGTLVRRTNLCDTCADESPGTLGESTVSWSPDGRRLAFTIHLPPDGRCAAFLVPSDPADGNDLVQFTFPDSFVHDYDPAWSPRGDVIAFGRSDNTIWSKGVPGLAADTTLHLVTGHHDGTTSDRGDLGPSFSPDGEWIAFSRKSTAATHWEIWKTPANGDTTRRVKLVTDTGGDDFYPQWSTDGAWILYQRITSNGIAVWKVPSSGGSPVAVLLPGAGLRASTPAFSPDGAVIACAVGPQLDHETRTLDAALSGLTLPTPRVVPGYPGTFVEGGFPVLSPRWSPDGTRLALRSKQLGAARRNTSLPPRIVAVDGIAPDAERPVIALNAPAGATVSFAVRADDPEGDPVRLDAFFRRDGMAFDAGSGVFTWTPPESLAGQRVVVRFQATTPSGGSAYALVDFAVGGVTGVDPHGATVLRLGAPRPAPFTTSVRVPLTLARGERVKAEVLDAAGRRVCVLADEAFGAGTHELAWDGRDARGRTVPPGLYHLRVRAGEARAGRKLVRLSR